MNRTTKQRENRQTEPVINLHLLPRRASGGSGVTQALNLEKNSALQLENAKFLKQQPQKTSVGRSRADSITLMCNPSAGVTLYPWVS